MKLKDLIKVISYDVQIGILPEGEYNWPIMTECADKIDDKYLNKTILHIEIEKADWLLVELKGLKEAP